ADDLSGDFQSLGWNLIGKTNGASGLTKNDIWNVNPKLGPLAINGGLTLTHALLPGSPAINAGDPAFVPPPAFDQRGTGFARVSVSAVDIGAFESHGFTLAIVSGNPQTALVGADFAQPLLVAVTADNVREPVDGGLVVFTPPLSGPG